ncbi:MAG: aminoacetone oxidase family FAD-binding enzyme, partial [Clostridia bacterium]|nr:aminoacetone oxidase family FAD-binding enzyme [Clostridia bacterium]
DKSSDVISALQREMKKNNVKIYYNTKVCDVLQKDGTFESIKVKDKDGKKYNVTGDKLIIATGGLSYPSTGSTGDGYEFAKKLGHSVVKLEPSLVPFNLKGAEYKELQGLSLRNVELSVLINGKKIHNDFGELLFTHFGISGPLVLSACPVLIKHMNKNSKKRKKDADANVSNNEKKVTLSIDLKPALSIEQLDLRILRDFEKNVNKNFSNALDELLPKKLIPIIIRRSRINPDKKVSFVTKEERTNLVNIIKNLDYEFLSFRGYSEAIITKGGINVKEVNPSTMESKIVKGVYFAGEILDVDAVTGGYNLQVAWSTGYLAGLN